MTADIREIILWTLGGAGTLLFAIVAFFLKRLIDQLDGTRKAQHSLRNDLQEHRADLDLEIERLRSGIRLGFERLKIKYHDIEGLVRHSHSNPPDGKKDRDSEQL